MITCTVNAHSKTFFNISKFLKNLENLKKNIFFFKNFKNGYHQKQVEGMRCFCAQAQKQVDLCEIYLAISSFRPCFKEIRIYSNNDDIV